MIKTKIERLFSYGSLRLDFPASYDKSFLNDYKVKFSKAISFNSKLAHNDIVNSAMLFIDKIKYSNEDKVIGNIIEADDFKGLMDYLKGFKSNEGRLEVRTDKFLDIETDELVECYYFFVNDGNNIFLKCQDYLEYYLAEDKEALKA